MTDIHAASLAAAKRFTLVGRAQTDGTLRQIEGKDTVGDRIVFNNPIFDEANERQVGIDQGQFVLIDAKGMFYDGAFTLVLDGGSLVAQGRTSNSATTTLAVTGGTGAFRGARGEVTLRPRADATPAFDVLFDLD